MIPLLLTRAAADATALAAELGPQALAAPCLEFEDLFAVRPYLPNADLLVASPRAAGFLARVGLDPSWRVLALAPATAAALRSLRLRVDLALEGGAAGLARLARPDAPVLFATSDLGGPEVLGVRPDAVRWALYRTACPSRLPEAAVVAMEGAFDVHFASPSAVDHFVRLAPGALARARRVLFHGATTGEAVRRQGREGEAVRLPRGG